MPGSRALAGEEPAGVDAQAVGEAQHELGREVDPALAGLEAVELAGGEPGPALELALAQTERCPMALDAGDDALGEGGHPESVATTGADAQGERWFMLAGDVDAAEYSEQVHDGEGWR